MNQINQKALNSFIETQSDKLSKEELACYKQDLTYFLDCLEDHSYLEAKELFEVFFKEYLFKKYPLSSSKMIEEYLNVLKRFYTVMYSLEKMTFEQYAKTFDWLVCQGDILIATFNHKLK